MDSLIGLMIGAIFGIGCYYANRCIKKNKSKE